MALQTFQDIKGNTMYYDPVAKKVLSKGGSQDTFYKTPEEWNQRQSNVVQKEQQNQVSSYTRSLQETDKKIAAQDKAYAEATSQVNDNPFYSEGTRVGKVAKLDERYQLDKGNLVNQRSTYQQQIDAYNQAQKQAQDQAFRVKEASKPTISTSQDAYGNTIITSIDPYTGQVISRQNVGGGRAAGSTAQDYLDKASGGNTPTTVASIPMSSATNPNAANYKPTPIPMSSMTNPNAANYQPTTTPITPIQPQATQPQTKSVGGFVSNIGRDVGENIQGLLSIPGVLWDIGTGKINAGDAGAAVTSGIYNEYKDLVTNPVETAYNKPVSTVLDVLPFLQMAKATKLRFAGEAGRAVSAVEDVANAGKVLNTAEDVADAGRATKTLTAIKNAPKSAVETLGNDFRAAVRGFEDVVAGDPFFKSSLDDMNKVAGEFKLTGSAQNQLTQAGKGFEDLTRQITAKLEASPKTMTKAQVKSQVMKELKDSSYFVAGDPKFEQAAQKMMDVIDKSIDTKKPKAIDVYKTKQSIGQRYSKSFNKDPQTSQLTELDITSMETYDILKKMVDNFDPSLKDISQLTNKQSKLFDITRALKRRINRPTLSLGAITPNAPGIPRITQSASDLAGRALQGTAKGMEVAGKAVGTGAKVATNPVTLMAGRQLVQPGQPGMDTVAPTLPTLPQQDSGQPAQPTFKSTGYTPDVIYKAIQLDQRETGGQNYTELKRLYDLSVDEEKRTAKGAGGNFNDLTDKQRSFVSAGTIADEALKILESSPDKINVGPVAGRLADIGSATGTESTEMTQFRSKLASARTMARNALLGANMSDKELESYLDATFDINLPPRTLQNRLKAFIADMKTSAYGQSGAQQ